MMDGVHSHLAARASCYLCSGGGYDRDGAVCRCTRDTRGAIVEDPYRETMSADARAQIQRRIALDLFAAGRTSGRSDAAFLVSLAAGGYVPPDAPTLARYVDVPEDVAVRTLDRIRAVVQTKKERFPQ